MKDSWVEWIWEIPENSDLVIFRRICNVNQWYQIAQELRLEEEENKSKIYLTIRYLNSKGEWIKEYILNPPKSVCCKKEDVLMARTWSTWQIISGVEWVFHNNFFKINYNKKKVNNKYLVYYLEQKLIKNILLLKAGVTTIPDLNHDSFLETPFILHSYEKQEKIVIFLDKKTKNIDNHIKKVEKRIRLYEEYKKSLIYNVVTGKVEV
jgi:type I restriction enzyme S subunit